VLDKDNLESSIYDSDDTWLLELYAPWCSHCKTLRVEWAKLATRLKGIAKVAKLDASVNRQFDQTYGLKGYPTIVLIPGGHKDKKIYYPYDGSRSSEKIEEWAIEKMKDAQGFLVPRITSEEVWKEYCIGLERPLCVIVFLPNILDSSQEERAVQLQMVKETINNFRDKPISFMWAQANDHPEVEEQFSLQSGFPAVLLISPNKRAYSIMKSSFTEENFENFIKESIGRRGGGRGMFGSFSKDITFSTVPEDSI